MGVLPQGLPGRSYTRLQYRLCARTKAAVEVRERLGQDVRRSPARIRRALDLERLAGPPRPRHAIQIPNVLRIRATRASTDSVASSESPFEGGSSVASWLSRSATPAK